MAGVGSVVGSVLGGVARAPLWVLLLLLALLAVIIVALVAFGREWLRYRAYKRYEKFAERVFLKVLERSGSVKEATDAVKAICPVVAKPFWLPESGGNELPGVGQVVQLVAGQTQPRHTRPRRSKKAINPSQGSGPAAVS